MHLSLTKSGRVYLPAGRIASPVFVMLASLLLAPSLWAQTASADLADIREDVGYLASDLLEGRATGSEGESLAGDYVAERFEGLGLAPAGDAGGWFQSFSFRFRPNPHDTTGIPTAGKNVVGLMDNPGDQIVVIGAHYDHLGWGGSGSRAPGDSAIHNGADDNASGVAALLDIAGQLEGKDIDQDVLFIAFSGEERGLIGSKYYADNPTVDMADVSFMINLDMVGRLKENRSLVVGGAGTSPTWIPLLEELGGEQFKLTFDSSGVGPSDHTSFYLKDKPVLHFFTGQHREYHKPDDDSHLINYEGIREIASLVTGIVETTDGDEPLAFTKTQDRRQQQMAARFKVSLGVMPDYAFEGKGMRVDAVLDDRPGAVAGMEDGDVITRIGETQVADIYSYMEALSKFESGDETTMTIVRDEDEQELTVKF